jgi:hypothetical protein
MIKFARDLVWMNRLKKAAKLRILQLPLMREGEVISSFLRMLEFGLTSSSSFERVNGFQWDDIRS